MEIYTFQFYFLNSSHSLPLLLCPQVISNALTESNIMMQIRFIFIKYRVPCFAINNAKMLNYLSLPVTQLGPTLCNPVDYSLPGSLVHGIFQAKILEWFAIKKKKKKFFLHNAEAKNVSTFFHISYIYIQF